ASLKETAARLAGERDLAAQALAAARATQKAAPSDADRAVLAELADKVRTTRDAERAAAAALDAFRRETERAATQRATLSHDRDAWQVRAGEASKRLDAVGRDLEETRSTFARAKDQPGVIQQKLDALAASLAEAEAERRQAADTLAEAETSLRDAESAARAA